MHSCLSIYAIHILYSSPSLPFLFPLLPFFHVNASENMYRELI